MKTFKTKSFTLIELLVVIAIIGLLVIIIAIPINRARRGASIARILQYEASLHRYLGSDIVGWWQFNEGEGSVAYDISGYNNDGTIHGATYVDGVPGKEGYALEFDGISDYVNVGSDSSLNLTNEITQSAWIYPVGNPTNDRGTISTKNASYYFQHYVDDRITVYTYWNFNGTRGGSSYFYSNNTVQRNQWNFVAWSEKNGLRRIYINGELDAEGQFQESIWVGTASLTIGAQGSTRHFNGKIDDLRIYSRALTSEEINTLYTETKDKYFAKE